MIVQAKTDMVKGLERALERAESWKGIYDRTGAEPPATSDYLKGGIDACRHIRDDLRHLIKLEKGEAK